jgi:methionine synthase II (cobalamin-independent)
VYLHQTKNTTAMITKDISIEELIEEVPGSVRYLSEKGIKCIACGEPIWGTLEDAAREKGFSDNEIDKFVEDLNNTLK